MSKKIGNLLLLAALLACTMIPSLWAAGALSISPSVQTVVPGEEFTVTVQLETESNSEVSLTEKPVGLEVIAKEFQGYSTSSIYQNGELTVKKAITMVYVLRALNKGRVGLTQIRATQDGKSYEHESLWLTAVDEIPRPSGALLVAEVSKTNAYVNEGILVRYYLYLRAQLASFDIKQFPKLNGFTKRYLQEQGVRERAEYQGNPYVRQLLYSAVVFPEKAGALKIDSMHVSAGLIPESEDGGGGLFDLFPSRRSMVTKTLSSNPVVIQVLSQPTLPKELAADKTVIQTGLVQDHQFQLELDKTKLLVNEPLQMRLRVQGPGNLEGLATFELLNHPDMEEFDKNAKVEVSSPVMATKTIDFTYLPRAGMQLLEQELKFTVLNPTTGQYELKPIKVPAITIEGALPGVGEKSVQGTGNMGVIGTGSVRSNGDNKAVDASAHRLKINVLEEFHGPLFYQINLWSQRAPRILSIAGLILALGSLMFYSWLLTRRQWWKQAHLPYVQEVFMAKEKVAKLQEAFGHYWGAHTLQFPLKELIQRTELSPSDQEYFIKMIAMEESQYQNRAATEINKGRPAVWDQKMIFKLMKELSRHDPLV